KPIEIFPAPTDVHRLVDGVVALSETKMKSQGIDLVEECSDVSPTLNVDAEKLRTCFINVVANAIQAMPEGGTMRIVFRRVEGAMVITFSDTGKGIEADVASHVFEPFFTTKRDGVGLGLFLSKAIVETHGGTIHIGPNTDGPGTTVTFTFPPSAVVNGHAHVSGLSIGR
ncbi:MAG TPA: ATP-binding protein, partial [Candidatus Binatus sp.]|nr:ATP-binding protein [Candidatus Binatus sp.]